MWFEFQHRVMRVLGGYSAHARRLRIEEHFSGPLQTVTATLFGSKGSSFAVAHRVARRVTDVFVENPEIRIRIYIEDMKLHIRDTNGVFVQKQ